MCASSASTGLCGGQRVTAVPTATGHRGAQLGCAPARQVTAGCGLISRTCSEGPQLFVAVGSGPRFLIFPDYKEVLEARLQHWFECLEPEVLLLQAQDN